MARSRRADAAAPRLAQQRQLRRLSNEAVGEHEPRGPRVHRQPRCSGAAAGAVARAVARPRLPGESEPWLLAHVADVVSVALERLLGAMRLHRAGLTHPLTGWHTRRYL